MNFYLSVTDCVCAYEDPFNVSVGSFKCSTQQPIQIALDIEEALQHTVMVFSALSTLSLLLGCCGLLDPLVFGVHGFELRRPCMRGL